MPGGRCEGDGEGRLCKVLRGSAKSKEQSTYPPTKETITVVFFGCVTERVPFISPSAVVNLKNSEAPAPTILPLRRRRRQRWTIGQFDAGRHVPHVRPRGPGVRGAILFSNPGVSRHKPIFQHLQAAAVRAGRPHQQRPAYSTTKAAQSHARRVGVQSLHLCLCLSPMLPPPLRLSVAVSPCLAATP